MMANLRMQRADGYVVTKAGFGDFPALCSLVDGLSEQSRALYNPWMFRRNPPLKMRLGQWMARLSLLPWAGWCVKMVFPYGYAVILKCEREGQLIGNTCLYNFTRVAGGGYVAKESKVIRDSDQRRGLSSFLTEALIRAALQEGVVLVKSGTLASNSAVRKTYVKHGYRFVGMSKNTHFHRGIYHDMEEWELELGSCREPGKGPR